MFNKLRKLVSLSLTDVLFLLASVMLLMSIGACLHYFGYRRTWSLLRYRLSRTDDQCRVDELELRRAQAIARIVSIAAHHGPYRANCLEQSLVLQWLLLRAGIPVEIKFGVPQQVADQATKKFTAHAWVEYSGINLSDGGNVQRHAAFAG